jgi:hypothetical protein
MEDHMQSHPFQSTTRVALRVLSLAVLSLLVLWGCSDEQSIPPTTGSDLGQAISAAPPGVARVNITFKEFGAGLGYDEFLIANQSDAGFKIVQVNFYFNTAASDIIIDMSPGPPGVGEGSWLYTEDEELCGLREWRGLLEGGKRIVLKWWAFDPGKSFRFGVDLDGQNLTLGKWTEDITGAQMANSTMVIDMLGPNNAPLQLTTQMGKINDLEAGVTVEKSM